MTARDEICRIHKLGSEALAFQLIAQGARNGVQTLLAKSLRAPVLQQPGYSRDALLKMGYREDALRLLGFTIASAEASASSPDSSTDPGEIDTSKRLREMLAAGTRADEFRSQGFNIHHMKRAGCLIQDLERGGYRMEDFLQVYSAAELKRAGYPIRDLRRYFKGHELRAAGFGSSDMRNAGFSIKELLNFGYN